MSNKITRRQFNKIAAVLTATATISLSGCSGVRSIRDAENSVSLAFIGDVHGRMLPEYSSPSSNIATPRDLIGKVNIKTGGLQPQLMGGYPAIKQALSAPDMTDSILIESGECWSGSALSSLSGIEFSSKFSEWMKTDVRLASHELNAWGGESSRREYAHLANRTLTLDDRNRTTIMEKKGVRVGFVGVTDPWLSSDRLNPREWAESIQRDIDALRTEAHVVIVVTDVGLLSSVFLSNHLGGADLILSAGSALSAEGLIRINRDSIPIVLGGARGHSFQKITINPDGFIFTELREIHAAEIHDSEAMSIMAEIVRVRGNYTQILDSKFGLAKETLHRSGFDHSPWDQHILTALLNPTSDSAHPQIALSPSKPYESVVLAGEEIRREHLMNLSGGRDTVVFATTVTLSSLSNTLNSHASPLLHSSLVGDNRIHSMNRLGVLQGDEEFIAVADYERPDRPISFTGRSQSHRINAVGWQSRYRAAISGTEGLSLWRILSQHFSQGSELNPSIAPMRFDLFDSNPGWSSTGAAGEQIRT